MKDSIKCGKGHNESVYERVNRIQKNHKTLLDLYNTPVKGKGLP